MSGSHKSTSGIQTMADNRSDKTPVYVELNGTLLATNTLWESALQLVRQKPVSLLMLPFWLFRGKAWFWHRMSQSVALEPSLLPFRPNVLAYLQSQKAAGRHLFLVTRSSRQTANAVVDHLGLFEGVVVGEGKQKLMAKGKLEAIRSHCKNARFEYVGQGRADVPVIEAASVVTLVNPSWRTLALVRRDQNTYRTLGALPSPFRAMIRSLRPHHWTKNLLLAVPLVVAQQWYNLNSLSLLAAGILCFSLIASSIYVCNDLLDLPADRRHPTKCQRPLAKGDLDIPSGLWMAVGLFALAMVLGLLLMPSDFVLLLLAYALTASAYSMYFKRRMVLDVVVLSGLYTIRIFAGGAAVDIVVSAWLMAFSMFFFLSLAFAKRYTELAKTGEDTQGTGRSRPYTKTDLEIFRSVGPTCGILSVLVLALYINSPAVLALYHQPQALWFLCPVLLYWILRVWFLTLRVKIDYDPVMLALRDRVSYVAAAVVVLILFLAAQ
jgi:4-hydroxybenzoate polyprenyltransferase